ncbi:hypothetical protein STPYR_10106 [uncultured Stenotrophomonas sp.]|uniref:Uncharacterized protein n=1 Tax=uncultured Stenotrophomonas sp. TaxID=165438 RepID=A0A1Y5Q2P7_9GAMM|nr:hypothetical protein STPYR_10106 [uncultured Stenotrophomonas sp.]
MPARAGADARRMKNDRTAVFHGEAARRVAHTDVHHEKRQGERFSRRSRPKSDVRGGAQ